MKYPVLAHDLRIDHVCQEPTCADGDCTLDRNRPGHGFNAPDFSGDDHVNHPKHYNSDPSGIETIDYIEHKSLCIGTAIKYLDRAPYKGHQIQDLEKAIWYVQREIQRLGRTS
jgi:hypothetical protein